MHVLNKTIPELTQEDIINIPFRIHTILQEERQTEVIAKLIQVNIDGDKIITNLYNLMKDEVKEGTPPNANSKSHITI